MECCCWSQTKVKLDLSPTENYNVEVTRRMDECIKLKWNFHFNWTMWCLLCCYCVLEYYRVICVIDIDAHTNSGYRISKSMFVEWNSNVPLMVPKTGKYMQCLDFARTLHTTALSRKNWYFWGKHRFCWISLNQQMHLSLNWPPSIWILGPFVWRNCLS